ncbi:hypothetical protein BS17DRAFT_869042 [Gyrodon lividus]|nr:hypothetical protein BS17DRAFT_869042 [Gyrodon lividus]
MNFTFAIKNASFNDPIAKITPKSIQRLRNPLQGPVDINSPGIHLSISCYLSLEHASQKAYDSVMKSTCRNFPQAEGVQDCLSFKTIKAFIVNYIGIKYVLHDMCEDLCLGFTGPFENLDNCPTCGKYRWNKAKFCQSNGQHKVPVKQFPTILLGPQLQAHYRDPHSARNMAWLKEKTRKVINKIWCTHAMPIIEDIIMGWDYLGGSLNGDIKDDDIVLSLI